uniref:Uncharacterized protein n=1 Tax=Cyprinus carpio TaxID=7962 RepID=A0A8C1GKA5_CYPCA
QVVFHFHFQISFCNLLVLQICVQVRELMAELLEDEKVSMEFAQLEEEYRILTEENRNLITVHSQRAQQLETLRVISQKRQGSS